jgi:hypothetical protein
VWMLLDGTASGSCAVVGCGFNDVELRVLLEC